MSVGQFWPHPLCLSNQIVDICSISGLEYFNQFFSTLFTVQLPPILFSRPVYFFHFLFFHWIPFFSFCPPLPFPHIFCSSVSSSSSHSPTLLFYFWFSCVFCFISLSPLFLFPLFSFFPFLSFSSSPRLLSPSLVSLSASECLSIVSQTDRQQRFHVCCSLTLRNSIVLDFLFVECHRCERQHYADQEPPLGRDSYHSVLSLSHSSSMVY